MKANKARTDQNRAALGAAYSTGEVTINDSTQREQFDNWWLDHGDDIGLSDQLRNFSKPR